MMRIRHIGLMSLMLIVAPAWTHALSVDFDIQPRALTLGETAICSFTIRNGGDAPAPSMPAIRGFDISPAGTEQSINIVNGRHDFSITHRFRLVPRETGTFTIGPFQYSAGGQTIDLPAIEVQVIAPATAGSSSSGRPAQWSDLVFARLTTERPSVFTQESFDLVLSIYFRGVNIDRNISLMNMPATGIALQPFQELQSGREVVNNDVYDVRRFRCRASALSSGTFRLEPTLRVSILTPRERRARRDPFFGDSIFGDSFFENIFGRGYEAHPVDIVAQPLEIAVRPLPTEGRPSNFSGAVGRFAFDATAKPTELNVGEPINLTLRIEGQGNIEAVSAPQLVLGDGFKVYEPKLVTREIDEQRGVGRKIFEQVIIPRSPEATTLPVISFVYFNPQTERYETISRGPFTLALRADGKDALKIVQGRIELPEAHTEVLGADILYLKPAPAGWKSVHERPWYRSPVFLGLQAVPPIALALIILIARRRDELSRNVAKARRQMAPRSARAALTNAQRAANQGDRLTYFESIWNAMAGYFGHRLNLQPGEISKDIVIAAMRQGGLAPTLLDELAEAFDRCEQMRFGAAAVSRQPLSSSETQELKQWTERIGEILRACERIRL